MKGGAAAALYYYSAKQGEQASQNAKKRKEAELLPQNGGIPIPKAGKLYKSHRDTADNSPNASVAKSGAEAVYWKRNKTFWKRRARFQGM